MSKRGSSKKKNNNRSHSGSAPRHDLRGREDSGRSRASSGTGLVLARGTGAAPSRAASPARSGAPSRSTAAAKPGARARRMPAEVPFTLHFARFFTKPFVDESGAPNKRNIRVALCTLGAVALTLLVWIVYWGFTHINAAEVYLNTEKVATIKWDKDSEVTDTYISEYVVKKLEADLGTSVRLNEGLTLLPVHASQKELVSLDYVLEKLTGLCSYTIEAAAITIDGEQIGILQNAVIADGVLDRILESYYQESLNITQAEFVEDVEAVSIYVDSGTEFLSTDRAYSILTSATGSYEIYTIKSGDALSSIASNSGMTLGELLALNPGYSESTVLQIGQTLSIASQTPRVSVRTYERVTYTEVVSKTTETTTNPNEYRTYSKVVQQGKDGQREVTADILRVNGVETGRDIVDTVTTVAPVTEIIEVGSADTPPSR